MAQTLSSSGLWHQQSLTGKVQLEGLFRQQNNIIRDFTDTQKSKYYIAGIQINSKSYLWQPDIITLDFSGEFNPETRDEKYIRIPNRSEVRTLNKLDLQTTIFSGKPVTISSYVNLNQSYFNRENLTNVKSVNKNYGGRISLNNKFLPVTLTYRDLNWDQKETETGREFSMNQNNLETRISKAFGSLNRNEFIYNHDKYIYTYTDQDTVVNNIDQITLNNTLFFDKTKKYNFSSRVNYYNQKGEHTFERFDGFESIKLRLPANFRLNGSYNYYSLSESTQDLRKHVIRSELEHQLFYSLTSSVYIDYSSLSQTVYNEKNTKTGVDFKYTKKIPFGRLNLFYRYFRNHRSMDSKPAPLQVIDEEHVLRDGFIELLDRPFTDPASVTVKDVTGTIIYQLDFDYSIIERNGYVEIQRIPGGQISNGQSVLIDYTASQEGDYSYNVNNFGTGINLLMFKNILEVYYRYAQQDYSNIEQTGLITLNYFSQDVWGTRLNFGFLEAGMEYDQYRSNIIPYKLMRYYVNLNGNIKHKLLLSLNGSVRDYLIIEDQINQQYANISGRMAYVFKKQTKASLEFGYLRQRGENLNLDVITAKAELSTSLRQLYLKGGIELYSRRYTEESLTMGSLFIKATRKF
ncbi:MAG: hypothetical protein GXO83_07765 [Chlorobi bacterium]|nr:hypothetical protein [Chlorobiota bacterium]